VLDSYAEFHGAFWGLAKAPGIKSQEEWAQIFAGQFLSPEEQHYFLDWFGVPEPQRGLVKRALDEIGMPKILTHMNTFGMTVLQGDAHSGQVLRISNSSRWGLIDFAWAHLGNPAIDIGTLMVWQSQDHVEFIKYYFEQLIGRTGCSEPGSPNPQRLPNCSVDDFILDCRVAAVFRGLMSIAIASFSFPDHAKRDKDYLAKHPELNEWFSHLHLGFRFFDQSTFDYIADRTKNVGSSFLSLSSESSSRPLQSMVDALSARDFHRFGTRAQ
jgi:hypothetical protein